MSRYPNPAPGPHNERNKRKRDRQKLRKKMRGGSPENKMRKPNLINKGETQDG